MSPDAGEPLDVVRVRQCDDDLISQSVCMGVNKGAGASSSSGVGTSMMIDLKVLTPMSAQTSLGTWCLRDTCERGLINCNLVTGVAAKDL